MSAISVSNPSLSFTSYTAVGNLSTEFCLGLTHCPIYCPLLIIFCQTLDFAFAAMLYSERKGRTHERLGRRLRVFGHVQYLMRPFLFLINITAKRKQGGFAFSACGFIYKYTSAKILPMQKIAPGVCYSNFKVLKSNTASRLSVEYVLPSCSSFMPLLSAEISNCFENRRMPLQLYRRAQSAQLRFLF